MGSWGTGNNPQRQRILLGSALVIMQLALIVALVALGAPAFVHRQAPLTAWILMAAGIALVSWALAWNRPGNFNVRPIPRAGGRLVEQGPYRWIRHPMYSAVIVCGVAAAWAADSWPAWLSAAILAAVLVAKAVLEERWMLLEHPGYAAYRARTRRFVPGVF
jgi:protein-S-isoprenylcysteine O-methyltransferase Ste14